RAGPPRRGARRDRMVLLRMLHARASRRGRSRIHRRRPATDLRQGLRRREAPDLPEMRHGPPRQDAAGRLGETVNALHRPEGQRLCIIGSGAISERVTSLLAARSDAGLTLVGIATQPGVRRCGWWPEECRQITNPDDLASLSPDII